MEDLHKRIAEICLLKYKQISKKKASPDNEWSPLAAIVLVEDSCSGEVSSNGPQLLMLGAL